MKTSHQHFTFQYIQLMPDPRALHIKVISTVRNTLFVPLSYPRFLLQDTIYSLNFFKRIAYVYINAIIVSINRLAAYDLGVFGIV